MRFKAIAGLLLFTPALAIPQATSVATSEGNSDDSSSSNSSNSNDSNDLMSIYPEATSIASEYMSVMETAVPSSWEYMNSAEIASVASAAAAGTYPAWYNDLPASIKAVVTELGGFDEELLGVTIAMGTTSSEPTSESAVATTAAGSSDLASTKTQTSAHASATSDAASSSGSTNPSSASSTGGAPIATAGVTMGVAGAVGFLGLALAL